jgi:hypothetical protein
MNLPGETSIGIFNLTCEQVKYESFHNQNRMEMDVSTLPKGMYVVKIQTREGVECQKVVME